MISFYHTHDFLFRSIADEKLTNFVLHSFCYKVLLPTVCSNVANFYDVLDCLYIVEWS